MPDIANFEVRIKPQMDERKIETEIDKVKKKFEKIGIDPNFKPEKSARDLMTAFQNQIGQKGLFQRIAAAPTGAKLGAAAGTEAGGGLFGQISGALGGIMTALGPIGLAVTAIAGIVLSFKPVMTLIKAISRILIEFLRPIANIVITLLMPILAILRPILKTWQAMMMPYMKKMFAMLGTGMKAMEKGETGTAMKAFGTAMLYAFKPLLDLFLYAVEWLVKGVTIVFLELFRPIIEAFGGNVDELKESAFTSIGNFFDSIRNKLTTSIDILALGVVTEAATAGVEVQKEIETITAEGIKSAKEAGEETEKAFLDAINEAKEILPDEFDDIIEASKKKGEETGKAVITTIEDVFDAIDNATSTELERVPSLWEGIFNLIIDMFKNFGSRLEESVKSLSVLNKGAIFGPIGSIIGGAVGAGKTMMGLDDFIMRPGQPPQKFSKDDTIMGGKGKMPMGGDINNEINVNINASMNSSADVRQLATELADNLNREIRRKLNY